MGAVSLNRGERGAGCEWLSALAFIGLLGDTIDVKYEDYSRVNPSRSLLELSQPSPKYPTIDSKIQDFLKENFLVVLIFG